jgi:transcriptional regulator with GAF, ATPase, and Fis domain
MHDVWVDPMPAAGSQPTRRGALTQSHESDDGAADLSAVFRGLSGVLLSDETLQSALRLVTALATETVPGSSGAGVTLTGDGGGAMTTAASDAVVERADALQYDVDEGPCLEAMRQLRIVRVDDLSREARWPAWTPGARALGILSVLSVPLHIRGDVSGALKVYASQPARFGEREERLLGMFAEQAVVLLANVRSREELERANLRLREVVESRDLVSMAKGVMMARRDIGERAAFAALVAASQQDDVPVREIARRVLDPYTDRDA